MKKIFGTDGIRGVANEEPMTVETALRVGRAVGFLFRNGHSKGRIVIGKDTRLSGYMLEAALVAGICSMGSDAILLGPLPTPGIGFITRDMRADAGIVISASHNPYQDNGIKVFTSEGMKLSVQLEEQLEELVFSGKTDHIRPTAIQIGKASRVADALGRYIVHLKRTFPSHLSLDGIKLVIDCAHGATYKVAPAVFAELGARVEVMGDAPDGTNINDGYGAVFPQAMAQKVLDVGAHLGVAFDGDGDRAIFSDEHGNILNGDDVLSICGVDLLKKGRLPGRTVVATIMSNMGLEFTLAPYGGKVVRVSVGDRQVFEEMQKMGYYLGGESSGHVIFREFVSTGDGIITALQMLAVMVEKNRSFSELARDVVRLPQVQKSIPVSCKPPLDSLPTLKDRLEKARAVLGDRGRVVVRYSGTENRMRVMVQGEDLSLIESILDDLSLAVEKSLGGENGRSEAGG
jgi:phosphoglucosamine mutase